MEWVLIILAILVLIGLNKISCQLEQLIKKSDISSSSEGDTDEKKSSDIPAIPGNPAGISDIFEEKREELIKIHADHLIGHYEPISKDQRQMLARFDVYSFNNEEIKRSINQSIWGSNKDSAEKSYSRSGIFEHDIKIEEAEILKPLDLILPLYEFITNGGNKPFLDNKGRKDVKVGVMRKDPWAVETYNDYIHQNAIMYKLKNLGVLENVVEPHGIGRPEYVSGLLVSTNLSELKSIVYAGSSETPPEDSELEGMVRQSIGQKWEADCKLFEWDPLPRR